MSLFVTLTHNNGQDNSKKGVDSLKITHWKVNTHSTQPLCKDRFCWSPFDTMTPSTVMVSVHVNIPMNCGQFCLHVSKRL